MLFVSFAFSAVNLPTVSSDARGHPIAHSVGPAPDAIATIEAFARCACATATPPPTFGAGPDPAPWTPRASAPVPAARSAARLPIAEVELLIPTIQARIF